MVKLSGKFVPIEEHQPFENGKGTGKMQQHLPHLHNESTGQHVYAITGIRGGGETEVGELQVPGLPPNMGPTGNVVLLRKAQPTFEERARLRCR